VDQFRQSADQFRQSADQFRESGQSGPDVVPFSIENMEIRSVKIHQRSGHNQVAFGRWGNKKAYPSLG
jgi:hypothetical protein